MAHRKNPTRRNTDIRGGHVALNRKNSSRTADAVSAQGWWRIISHAKVSVSRQTWREARRASSALITQRQTCLWAKLFAVRWEGRYSLKGNGCTQHFKRTVGSWCCVAVCHVGCLSSREPLPRIAAGVKKTRGHTFNQQSKLVPFWEWATQRSQQMLLLTEGQSSRWRGAGGWQKAPCCFWLLPDWSKRVLAVD